MTEQEEEVTGPGGHVPDATGPHGLGMGPGQGRGDGTGLRKKAKQQEKKNPGSKIMDEILGKDKKGNKPPRKSFL